MVPGCGRRLPKAVQPMVQRGKRPAPATPRTAAIGAWPAADPERQVWTVATQQVPDESDWRETGS